MTNGKARNFPDFPIFSAAKPVIVSVGSEKLHPVHNSVVLICAHANGGKAFAEYVGAVAFAGEPGGHYFVGSSVAHCNVLALGLGGHC